jgi:ABC-type lipoprotein export system ATPase subunit
MVRLDKVVKTYQTRRGICKALDEVTLSIEKGRFVLICGPSGSGKTTLLMTIAAMLRPSSGIVSIEGQNLYAQTAQARARFRAHNIGFVFQEFALVPYLNVVENILLAGGNYLQRGRLAVAGTATDHAYELIEKFGLADRIYHKPCQLSAGEKQRTAIARALLNRPKIILADEPTGNLDADNTAAVLRYLAEFHRQGGTVILATHGPAAKDFADRVVYLRNGKIQSP